VPNPKLTPENSYNFEIGISKIIEDYIKLSVTGYYTLLTDAIVRTYYTYNSSDSLFYDGDRYRMITNSNASRAYIRGVSFALVSDISKSLQLKSTLNLTEGKDKTSDVPMAHIPPAFGRTSASYNSGKFSGEVYLDYNGWKHLKDFSPLGEDNESEATPYGYPSWYTLNIKTNYKFSEVIDAQFAVENIFNVLYKTFASGVASPGRNFILTLKLRI